MTRWAAGLMVLCGAFAQDGGASLRRALELHKNGKAVEAIPHYRAFLKTAPERFDIRSNLGAALSAAGRYDEAITQYRLALKSAPSNPGIRRNFALALYKSMRLTEAIAELEKLRVDSPNDLTLALLHADCEFRLGHDSRVVEILKGFPERHPDNTALAYLMGTALLRTSQIEEGERLIQRVLSRGDSAEVHLMMGTAHVMGGAFNEAAEEFKKAIALNSKLPLAHSHLGKTQLELGERESAEESFRRELAINPTDFDANLMLGIILRESQRADEALRLLETARRVRPAALEVGYQIALARLAMGESQAALRELEALLKAAPEFAEAHVSLATVYARLGRKADAERHNAIARSLMEARR